jgi:hypothetical protein
MIMRMKFQELINIKQKVTKSKFFSKKVDKLFAEMKFLCNFATANNKILFQ